MAEMKQPLSELTGVGQVVPEVSGSSRVNVGESERLISAAGGALLVMYGLGRGSLAGLVLAAAGGALAWRGVTGYCPVNESLGRNSAEGHATDAIEISKVLTINKPREEVFRFWRNHENLPKFMRHLEDVKQIDDKHSHWKARIPGGVGTIEWDAEIIQEVENERIVWRSVEGATVDNAGEVRFMDAPNGRGTELHTTIQYRPPAGQLGELASKLFNPAFKSMIETDLRRFKQLMETGQVVLTTEGYPAATKEELEANRDRVFGL